MQACLFRVLLALSCSAAALSAQDKRPHLARLAYLSDEDQNDVFELFSVPVDGSAPSVRLNSALPAGGDVGPVRIASTKPVAGGRVLYIADQLTDGVNELFSVPDDGSSPPVRLNGPMVTGGNVSAFSIAEQRVVYLADEIVNNRDELFSMPLDGSSARVPLTPSLDVNRFVQPSSDGSLAVFTIASGSRELLHVVRTDGSQPPLLLDDSGTPSGFAVTFFPEIEIAPGGLHVVYIAAEDDDESVLGNIFSARLDGSTPPVKLNPGASFLAQPSFISRLFRIAPDGQRVVYAEEDAAFIDLKLQSVRMDGTGLVDLVPGGESGNPWNFRISEDSVFAYFPSHDSGGTRLRRSRLDGSQSLTLLGPIAENVIGLELAPGGASLVFATGNIGNNTVLFSLQVPQQPVWLGGSPPANGVNLGVTDGFGPLGFTPDGKRVVFRGDLDTDDVSELCSALLDGSQLAQRLNPPLSGNLDVLKFQLSADGKRALYQADQLANDVFELFSVPVDASSAPVRLNETPVTGGDVTTFTKPEFSGRVRRAP